MRLGILLSMVLMTTQSLAQVTGGYWGNQFGSRGLLLNGAVIASCDDETAIFYNPAGLGLTDDFGVAVSLITPTYNFIKTSDLLGDRSEFVDDGLGLAPGLVAAKFQPFGSDKINAGVTIFKRFESDVNYGDRVLSTVPSEPGALFVGDLEYNRELSETWVGVGMSFALHERLSFGFSQFFTWRGEELNVDFTKEFVRMDDPSAIISSWRTQFRYSYGANAGVLTKLGLSWRPYNIKVGITYTSSTYGLALRSADYKYNDTKVRSLGISELSSNAKSTELASYKTPWSVGAGLEFKVGKTLLCFSAEYFAEVTPYSIIDDVDDPYDGLSTGGEEVRTIVQQGFDRVLNVAFGMERSLNSKYSWFLGGRSDFSPTALLEVGDAISFLGTNPDIFHVSLGGAYLYKKSKFSIGLDYGFGYKSGGQQFIDLDNVNEDNLFTFDGRNTVDTQYHSLALFFTYDL